MTKVFVARHPTEAHLVKGLLESHGIDAEVQGEALFGVRGEAPVMPDTLPTVWVLDDGRTTEALEILSGHEPEAIQAGVAWSCPGCRETVEPQFSSCWQCGTARPPDARGS